MGYLKGIGSLLLVLVVWTGLLFFTRRGWGSLWVALVAIFHKDSRDGAIHRWEADDERVNKILGGKHHHPISGRTGYHALKTESRRWLFTQDVINVFFWFQPHHCFNAINWALYPEDERELKARHWRKNGD